MATPVHRSPALHPVQAVLLAGILPLFLGGLLSDWAYATTAEVQWSNFAAWLIAGAMVFTGFSLLWSFLALLRNRSWRGRRLVTFVLLLAAFILGFVNSFVHARDAWGIMPGAMILSVIVTVIALGAVGIGFAGLRTRETQ
ncbi:hypothetical protein [Sphingosinicella sp. BN140058]|uniref:hypothetical protein n=1 Tax=Sphingosinicella sp. BN140058 TaxID=1892855 RepID=UPI001FB09564|nr:hypothetical protein [Sphingosinicella sp. BN140058]